MLLLWPLTSVDSKSLVLRAILSHAYIQYCLLCHYLRHGFLSLGFQHYHLLQHALHSMGGLGKYFLACPRPSFVRFLSAFQELSWWLLSSSLPPNLFALSAWGAAFVMIFLGQDSLFVYVSARLLAAFIVFPVLWGCLFAGASLECLL